MVVEGDAKDLKNLLPAQIVGSVTTIDSAGYYLNWVYRTADAHKDYYMLPAGKVNTGTLGSPKE